MRRRLLSLMMIICLLIITGCEVNYQLSDTGFVEKDWELVEKSGKKTTVNLYVYGNDQGLIDWLNAEVKREVLSTYSIRLNVVSVKYEEILSQLRSDMVLENQRGDIDLVLLDRTTDFKQLNEEKLLYGPFLGSLKAYALQGNHLAVESNVIDNINHNGFAVPFAKESLYFIANEDYILDLPENYEQFIEAIHNNPDLFTFPAVDDPIGARVLRGFLIREVGYKAIVKAQTKAELEQVLMPAFNLLKDLKKDFYQGGTPFPATHDEVDQLFRDNHLIFSVGSELEHIYNEQKLENYPEGAKPLVVEGLLPYNPKFFVMPFNAGNKSGAMLTLHTVLTPKMQASLLVQKGPGKVPVINLDLLTSEELSLIQKAVVKKAIPKGEALMRGGIADVPLDKQKMITELWKAYLAQHP